MEQEEKKSFHSNFWKITKRGLGKTRILLERFGRAILVPVTVIPLLALITALGFMFEEIFKASMSTYVYENNGWQTAVDAIKEIGKIPIVYFDFILVVGLTAGLAKEEKLSASMTGLMTLLAFYVASNLMTKIMLTPEQLKIDDVVKQSGITSKLGMKIYDFGALGATVASIFAYFMHKWTYQLKFPKVISFFGGTRFSPVAATVTAIPLGLFIAFIWTYVNAGLTAVASGMIASKSGGPFLFGSIERILVPFGLHHTFNYLLYYTQVGGTYTDIHGKIIGGVYNIVPAMLSDGKSITVENSWIMNGKFVSTMFCLPGAAVAMYFAIPKEHRKEKGSLIIAAGLSSLLSGVTEPLDFTYLFVSPMLYGIHVVLTGFAHLSMYLCGFCAISSRSSGIIVWAVNNLPKWNSISKVWGIFIVGPAFFGIYYVVFYFFIKKFDIKTPGRNGDEPVKLFTKKDFLAKKENKGGKKAQEHEKTLMIIKAYGGADNIIVAEHCFTRLRFTVKDVTKFDEKLIKEAGAFGFKYNADQIQSIFGPTAGAITSDIRKILNAKEPIIIETTSETKGNI